MKEENVPAFFDFLYEESKRDRESFACLGLLLNPPNRFRHSKWELIAEIPKKPLNGDGQPVKLYEMRLPARFFKLEAVNSATSTGKVKNGFTLTTGSGDEMAKLVGEIALAVSEGMIGLQEEEQQ
jgi:hypothetical protein